MEAAKAAEVRAAALAEVEVGVLARAAELAVAAARKELQYESKDCPSGIELSKLEECVRQTHADEAVAKARASLLRWELKALQLRASGHVEDTAAVPEMGLSAYKEEIRKLREDSKEQFRNLEKTMKHVESKPEVPRAAEQDW